MLKKRAMSSLNYSQALFLLIHKSSHDSGGYAWNKVCKLLVTVWSDFFKNELLSPLTAGDIFQRM